MLRVINVRLIAVLLLACAAAGCEDEDVPTNPTPPSVATITETFSGEVTQNGSATHSFSVASLGPVTATLKSIGTDNTLVVSFALGNWDATNSSCSVVLANDQATGGAVLSGTMTAAGTLCARVGDVGNIQTGGKAAYSIEVAHP